MLVLLRVPRVSIVPVVVDSLTRRSRAGIFCIGIVLGGLNLAAALGLLALNVGDDIRLLSAGRRSRRRLIDYDGRGKRLLAYGGHSGFYGLLAMGDVTHGVSVARSTARQAADRAEMCMAHRGLRGYAAALAPSSASRTLYRNVTRVKSEARRVLSGGVRAAGSLNQAPGMALAGLAARRGGAQALMLAAVAAGAVGFDVLDSVAPSTGGLAATACSAARCALTAASVAGNVTAAGALAHLACDCIARTDLHLPVRRFTRVNANGDWQSWETILAPWCVGIDVSANDATFIDQVEDYLRRCFHHPQDVVAFDAGERIISAYRSIRDALTSAAFAALVHAQFRADARNELFELLEASDFACSTNSHLKVWLIELLVELAVKKELASRLEAA